MVSLFFVLVAGIIAVSLTHLSQSSLKITHQGARNVRSLYVAIAGSEKAKKDLDFFYRDHNGATEEDLTELDPPAFDGYTFETPAGGDGLTMIKTDEFEIKEIERGNWAGLFASAQRFDLTSTVTDQFRSTASVLEQIDMNAIPVAQFAVFYEHDLEILPGPQFIIEGWVHTNGDLYVGSENSLSFDSKITAKGDVYHYRKDNPNAAINGSVNIKDADGNYQAMGNLDSTNPDWAEESQTRWDGRVRSQDHLVPNLSLPLETGENPHDIIERANESDSSALTAAKFMNKADLKIINGVGYDKNGNVVPLTYHPASAPATTKSIISTKTFKNYRENKTIIATELNVGYLIESGINVGDGVIYISDNQPASPSSQAAVRITNGATLPAGGLTVATDNPIYVKGNYNSVSTKPSLVVGDAVNILSNNWSDSNSTYSSRIAGNTTVKTVVMTGNTETVLGQYNGGLENVLRFLEQWFGKTLTFRGSIIDMWNSEIATGAWIYGSPQYTAPNRDWRFDSMYLDPLNSPPGIPVVYSIERIEFAHRY